MFIIMVMSFCSKHSLYNTLVFLLQITVT